MCGILEIMMTGPEIRQLRKRLGMNQTQFAQLFDTQQITVSRWELGRHKPHKVFITAMQRLATETVKPA